MIAGERAKILKELVERDTDAYGERVRGESQRMWTKNLLFNHRSENKPALELIEITIDGKVILTLADEGLDHDGVPRAGPCYTVEEFETHRDAAWTLSRLPDGTVGLLFHGLIPGRKSCSWRRITDAEL